MMKRYFVLLATLPLSLLLLLTSCTGGGGATTADTEDSFVLTATLTAIGEKLEVEVTEGPYGASGPYWVITSGDTAYYNKNGKEIARSDLRAGDTVTIVYGGQVMMSYPPQIVAKAVTVK